jgi:hypothetical protein
LAGSRSEVTPEECDGAADDHPDDCSGGDEERRLGARAARD